MRSPAGRFANLLNLSERWISLANVAAAEDNHLKKSVVRDIGGVIAAFIAR
jgi:hypothetical protein